MIGGDLNVVLHPDLDKVGGDKILSHAAGALHFLMDKFDFTDICRHFHPYTELFTWGCCKPVSVLIFLPHQILQNWP